MTTRQLLDLGLTRDAIRHAVAAGHLHPVHRGVFAVGRPDLDRLGRWSAAVLACGDGALLSHGPAALLWGILERGDERPHVTVATDAGRRRRPGIRVSRTTTLRAGDNATWLGIAVTAPARTVLDLAVVLRPWPLRSAVRQAVRLRLASLDDLIAIASALPGDRRAGRLQRVLSEWVPREELTESELEARFLSLCIRSRLPLPDMQVRAGRRRLDFVWPDRRLVVETDGRRDHETVLGRSDDHAKDRDLARRGFLVLRFTWADVVNRPAAVAREIRFHLTRRAA